MRILGIDPGYATIGYGIIDYSHGRFSVGRLRGDNHKGGSAV